MSNLSIPFRILPPYPSKKIDVILHSASFKIPRSTYPLPLIHRAYGRCAFNTHLSQILLYPRDLPTILRDVEDMK